MLKRRAAGILMHPTSLPSPYGIGDLGPSAYAFADFLRQAGVNYWQMLPVTETTRQTHFSPYSCCSAFAGNSLLISPQLLYRQGWLDKRQMDALPTLPADMPAFGRAAQLKNRLLNAAFERFESHSSTAVDYEAFCERHRHWLADYALYKVIQQRFPKKKWAQWPAPLRDRDKIALVAFQNEHRGAIAREYFIQYLFDRQFSALKRYCNDTGILLFGDLPIYVVYDSADVWTHPHLFKLKPNKTPAFIAGVPPDYYSKTGQLWGNPVYDWQANAKSGYRWWLERIRHNLSLFDLLRIDHFRGFEAFWQVPAGRKTAVHGTWIKGPGTDFFEALFRQIPQAALAAEDLGVITAEVRELIAAYALPCMKVLQFAFNGKADNIHLPHSYERNCIVYTGTHDNNTTRGWFKRETTAAMRRQIAAYLGRSVTQQTIVQEMIRLALSSPARLCVFPMQDVLGLDAAARMNTPAKPTGNWQWRMAPESLEKTTAGRLRDRIALYDRL
jgi:4-alpha-glucanotransferase